MIKKIQIKESIGSILKTQFIDGFKGLNIITGVNGSGKSQFLSYIASNNKNIIFESEIGKINIKHTTKNSIYHHNDIHHIAVQLERFYMYSMLIMRFFNEYFSQDIYNSEQINYLQKVSTSIIEKRIYHRADIVRYLKQQKEFNTLFYIPFSKEPFEELKIDVQKIEEAEKIKAEAANKIHDLSVIKNEANKDEIYTKINALVNSYSNNPIDETNKEFDKYKEHFKYQIGSLGNFYKNNVQIDFNKLSTGEKIIFNLIYYAYKINKLSGNSNAILLLDEPDAHLNPAFIKILLDVLCGTFVKRYGIQVFVTSHNPILLNLASHKDCAVFKMDQGILEKTSQERATHDLAQGLVPLSFLENLFKDKDYCLFVEGETDKVILENAMDKLGESKLKDKVNIVPTGSCHSLVYLVHGLCALVSKNKMLGLLDSDEEANRALVGNKLEGKNENKINKSIQDACKDKFIRLNIPSYDKAETFKEKRTLTIEFMFNPQKIPNDYLELNNKGIEFKDNIHTHINNTSDAPCDNLDNTYESKDSKIILTKNMYPWFYKIKKDKKTEFAKSTKDFAIEDFNEFEKIFKEIKEKFKIDDKGNNKK